jgi:hypothetical protein
MHACMLMIYIDNPWCVCFPIYVEKTPRKYPSLAKYPPKYSSTEQPQVALRTCMFLKLGLNNEKSLHILPLQSLPLLSLRLQSLPLQTLRLVFGQFDHFKHKEWLSVLSAGKFNLAVHYI